MSDTDERSRWRRLYIKWVDMNKRCYNPNSNNYKDYGARGIKVCHGWHTYAVFKKWAISVGYDPDNTNRNEQTIDRINVNGNYEPDNCRFVSAKVQNYNRRNNIVITLNNKNYTFEELADKLGTTNTYLRNQYYHNKDYQDNDKRFVTEVKSKLDKQKG